MSWLVTAIALTATTAAVSARGQYISGRVQEDQLKRQAEQEKLAAQSRELQRRQELNRALSANVVGLGQSGISGEGTPASIALSGAKQAAISEGAISLADRLREAQLRRAGSEAARTGALQAGSTLLQAGAQMASLGASPSSSGGST